MKTFNIILVMLVLASVLIAQSKDMTRTFEVEKGVTLNTRINPGDIVVKTWDKNEILVKIKGLDSDEHEDVDIYEKSNTLFVKYNSSYGWSDDLTFDFTVPINCHLELNTTGGDITLKNDLTGRVSLNTSGGDIEMKNVSGKLQVNTSGGDIEVGDVNGPTILATSGGDIKVKTIRGESASIKTMGGDIDIVEVDSDVDATTYGGDIHIGDIGGKAIAKTFGGDVELGNVTGSAKMETYGGNLELKSATGEVYADTKGGDITLRNVKGSLNAKTAGGRILAELDPSGNGITKLKSAGGNIILILPADAKADIDASIRIRGSWGRHKDDYSIESDFMKDKPSITEDRKEIKSEFSINGGGEKIMISTVNSNIQIKKK